MFLFQLAGDLEFKDVLETCSFQGILECSFLFKNILTDEGLCFTFNALNDNDLYRDEFVFKTFPLNG